MIDTKVALDTTQDLLAALLTGAVEDLDIPSDLAREARERYTAVGTYLNGHGDLAGGAAWNVYPQGSFPLGTVVRPIGLRDDFDIDLVCLRMIQKTSTTQQGLKLEVGEALQSYVASTGDVTCQESGRCWILDYVAHQFHMDVLPAIPDPDGRASGILLTDRDFHEWLHSDPIAYTSWFKERMAKELLVKRAALAEKRRSTIDAVPDWDVKTTLQRVVQVLKRHRDIHFANDWAARPPSMLLTTLAARAFSGETNLYEAVIATVDAMPKFVEKDGTTWVVANPTQSEENFADKWQTHADRAAKFFAWMNAVRRDLQEAQELKGLDQVSLRLERTFGEGPIRKAAAGLAGTFRVTRESGGLSMAAGTGSLGTVLGGRKVKDHLFHGEEPAEL